MQVVDEIVYGRVVVPVALALCLFQLIVMVLAIRRRGGAPLSLKAHAIAGAAIALLPILIGVSVHAARAMMLAVYFHTAQGDGGEKAVAVHRGLSGQVNAIPFAISTTGLCLTFWFAGLAFTLSAPRSDGRARSFPPAALVAAGILPTAVGALQWSVSVIRALASMAGQPADARVVLLAQTLDAAHSALVSYARLSAFAIPALAVIAIVLIIVRGRDPGPAAAVAPAAVAPARPPAHRGLPAASAVAVALAALLVIKTRPIAAENEMPWPPPTLGDHLNSADPPTPDLVGPDPLEQSPVVLIYPDHISLDGSESEDFASLRDKLSTLRMNYQLLHPGFAYERSPDFNEMAVIVAAPTVTIPRLAGTLNAVRDAEYYRPLFAFTKAEVQFRPVLGRVQRVNTTGARVKLAFVEEDDEISPDTVQLWVRDFADYGAFARRVVELRTAGKPVIVYINRRPR